MGPIPPLSGTMLAALVAALLNFLGEPVKTLEQTVTRGGASGLDVPLALPQAVQTQLVCNLSDGHGIRKILLVGKDEQQGVPEFILIEHALELLAGLGHTVAIVAVNDEDNTLGVLEVVPPKGADLVLTTDIPDGELDVAVLDSLNVKADGRDSGDNFAELELVEDGGLASSVKTDHQNAHLLLLHEQGEEAKKLRSGETHFGSVASDTS